MNIKLNMCELVKKRSLSAFFFKIKFNSANKIE